MRRAETREANQHALIDAALADIAEHGYQASRLADIAARAGLTTGAIYSIFGSKRALLIAATKRLVEEYQQTLRPLADPDLDLPDVVRGYARAVLESTESPRARERFSFELESLAATLRDPQLMSEVDAQVPSTPSLLTTLLTGRRIGATRTTAAQAGQLAPAVHALVTGFAQHAVIDPNSVDRDFVIASAVQLTALVSATPGTHPDE
ncbi:TetR/AcrR family transcriptional regulator [Nocardia neocaledoniensis]|uniref:TetR/AcrR family transcriptional regulator n=1 Tax=Nocardia neocaledoniensis TaxID=236511 RepID=UPI002454967A|nr:TetR/AcrR family transcriptional regulator [Nocardia neocaledoniensis]